MPFLPVLGAIGSAASAASTIGGALGGGKGADFKASGVNSGDIYNANQNQLQGLQAQKDLNAQLAGQNGIGNQSSVFNQMQDVAKGQGFNPAQAMLAQQTGANTANQAALMAGQRGASANPALIARQAAMQGAANQQQAVGQGATLQANQSQNALNQMGSIAGQQVNQQLQGAQSFNNAAAGYQQNVLGNVGNQNQSNTAIQQGNQKTQSGLAGGLIGAAGNMASMAGLPKMMAQGGMIDDNAPKSRIGMYYKGGQVDFSSGGHVPGKAEVSGDSFKNDKVKALLSPKEIVIPRSITLSKNAPEKSAQFVAAILAKNGMRKK